MFSDEPAAALALLRALGVEPVDLAVVLGTGLGGLADEIEEATSVPYAALPGFPAPRVGGHAGRLAVGRIAGRRVALMQGRAHYYERGEAAAMGEPIKCLAGLGARAIILTNAAGSLRTDWRPGTVAILADHLNLAGANPLFGDPSDARFVTMTDAYDPALRAGLRRAGASLGLDPPEAVYAWFSGPSFETPAEIRMARMLGADLVGMSSVPETLLARRFGLRVAGLSLVTNLGAGLEGAAPRHGETQAAAAAAATRVRRLLTRFIGDCDV
ncbi:MAG: purine-nucleoside phosphorylase [Rhodoblastus sp.]|nr:MAG: purine-nucleoside phosphorylase [Rhodoblastus sp.]